jgi:hypothetical protein
MRTTGNGDMGDDRNMPGACRPTASAAGGVVPHLSGTPKLTRFWLMVFLISSSIEFC